MSGSTDRNLSLSTLAIKYPVRLATTAHITLSGLLTIDDVVLVKGDRVLVKDQTDARQNGIWVADRGSWSRAQDWRHTANIAQGTRVYVIAGTIGAGREYQVATANPEVDKDISFTAAGAVLAAEAASASAATAAAAAVAAAASDADAVDAAAVAVAAAAGENFFESFGVVGDGTADDTAALQAAIDYAFAHNMSRLVLPNGAFKITSPLYLDPPGNLRSNPTAPTLFGWTIELVGSGPNLGGVGGGSILRPTFDNAPALWVGPACFAKVSRVAIIGQVSVTHPILHNADNAGIAVSGGNAGAQKTVIEDVYIQNFYTGISVGPNNGSFGEVNTFSNCVIVACYRGTVFHTSNTVVHTLINCTVNATFGVVSLGSQVNVIGGEYAGTDGGGTAAAQYAAISSVSALTDVGGSPKQYTFQATIASPQSYWASGAFNVAMLILPHFGVVPFTITAFNAGTSVATFQTTPEWTNMFFYTSNPLLKAHTDFDTELQAATHIYACEMTTLFRGKILATGWRVEFPSSACYLDTSGVSVTDWACLRDGFANYDITLASYWSAGSNQYAHFLANQAFGFIKQGVAGGGAILLENNQFNTIGGVHPGQQDALIYDLSPLSRFVSRNNNMFNPNVRTTGQRHSAASSALRGRYCGDWGEFDRTPYRPRAGADAIANFDLRHSGSKTTPYKGGLPQGGIARLTPADVTALTGVVDLSHPQTIADVDGDTTVQQLQDHHVCVVSASGAQTYALAKRRGSFFSYGATLTIAANYKGQTPFLSLTGGANRWWVFPGLEIVIDAANYVVTGVYYSLGYITVQPTDGSPPVGSVLAGTKTTVYELTEIGQNAIIMQKFGRQCEFVSSALSELAGNTYARGDLVWITAASASASPGWVCVVAGVVGSGAQFAPMAALGSAVTP